MDRLKEYGEHWDLNLYDNEWREDIVDKINEIVDWINTFDNQREEARKRLEQIQSKLKEGPIS